MGTVMIGIPSYKGEFQCKAVHSLFRATKEHQFDVGTVDSSATCVTFNRLWINALELYEAGKITHFLMYHSDIVAEEYFLDKMMAIMKETGAEMLSAIVPIKNSEGVTSTALEEPCGDVPLPWRVRRLTMKEIMAMPETWTHPKLLNNTGLMLVDLSAPWTKEMYFHFDDKIIMHHGRRVAVCNPEDWMFSREARAKGAKLFATRAVKLEHYGEWAYTNRHPWGSFETDFVPTWPEDASKAAEVADKVRGYMAWEELATLADFARGKDVLEVGSWLGRSTKAMAQTATRVYAIDHWKGTVNDPTSEEAKTIDPWAEFNHNCGPEINSRRVLPINRDHSEVNAKMTYHDGLTLDTCPIAPVDMVFIDGDHEYEAVKRDIINGRTMLKPGGMLSGHDFGDAHPGVMKAVMELVPGFKVAPMTSIWYATIQDPVWPTP